MHVYDWSLGNNQNIRKIRLSNIKQQFGRRSNFPDMAKIVVKIYLAN